MPEQTEITVDRNTASVWPDGSKIEMNRYRADPQAPWIIGPYEITCGECGQIGERTDLGEARIEMLEHLLEHTRSEIAQMRLAFLNIGRLGA